MAKVSQQVKEIVQIVVFLLIVGSLIGFYAVYPLNKTKTFFAREDIDSFNPDSLAVNDPTPFVDAGLTADTFWIDADGLTDLACLYLEPEHDSVLRGTVVVLHREHSNRLHLLPLAKLLVNNGFTVVTYDQRASGLSGGKYFSDGQLEVFDLGQVLPYLDLRQKLHHPVVAVGFGVGADAAVLSQYELNRIDGVIAVEPYLTTEHLLSELGEEHEAIRFPFFKKTMFFWYQLRSGYEFPFRNIESLQPIEKPTVLMGEGDFPNSEEVLKLQEISDSSLLRVEGLFTDTAPLAEFITRFAQNLAAESPR